MSAVLSVTFNSTAAGTPTGTLTVLSNGVPSTVALAGVAPISLNLSASASSVTAGTPFTLSWNVTAGASCLATGGSPADGWTGSFSGSGSVTVTEAAVGNYLYGLNCNAGQQAAQEQAKVLVNYPMAQPASSGGGGLDLPTLVALLALGATRALRYGKSSSRIA